MRLSIILPVYNVQPYLAACLDSILHQDFEDFEVIAVDDASPDNSAAILAAYAARDNRIRIVSLPENRGLGRARNAGLDEAKGERVWFLDSDDWLEPGAIRACMERAEAVDADVLIFGWERVYPDGRRMRAGGQELLARGPDTFTLAGWPDVLGILHVAWNKIVRIDLLRRAAIRFEAGWYEDIPFSYPLLLEARRIALLDRVCVNYRQQDTGTITSTSSDRHFEAFAQWEKVMAFLAASPARREGVADAMFARMMWHCAEILNKGSRVPAPLRRRFFAVMQQLYRRYRPPEFRAGWDFGGLGLRLVGAGAYRSFRQLYRARRLLRTFGFRIKRMRGLQRALMGHSGGSPALAGQRG